MRAQIHITHTPANPDRPHPGWYCVTVSTPSFGDEPSHDIHQTFTYGPDEVYPDASTAFSYAHEFYSGAYVMFRALSQGGCDNQSGLMAMRMEATKIDRENSHA